MMKIALAKFQMNLKWWVVSLLGACILLVSLIPIRENSEAFHSKEEWNNYMRNAAIAPPLDSVHIFPTALQCNGCHGYDPQMNANIDWEGNDVNVYDDWSTSMMANSAKDPFWKAKVSHEVMTNPNHKLDLETKCTSCHAPQGHFTALLKGADHYTMEELSKDSIGLDGVSCGACHMKSAEGLESLFSGEANYDTSGVMYGPYIMPFAAPMNSFVGFNPVFSQHINSSGICASCHTLSTQSVDLEGEFTGESFIEQATYHEWINSDFDDDGDTPQSCQSCHMPRIEDNVVISANYLFLQPRFPFGLHDMIGANIPMIKMIQDNKEKLNITAADEHFEETLAKTLAFLQEKSLDIDLSLKTLTSDTLTLELQLINKAGHKFPSGYPSRRVFVEFVVTTEVGDTLFSSGLVDDEYRLIGHDDPYEPHHNIITNSDQVQIYEFVVGNVNGDVTTVLEQSHQGLKDNRLPPRGFKTTHPVYDTTRIYGAAIDDLDFNRVEGQEGSGSDLVQYKVALEGYSGLVDVSAKVFYQALPPRWLAPMFEIQSPEIDSFRIMYDEADLKPSLVAQDTLLNFSIESLSTSLDDLNDVVIYPNPSHDGIFHISSNKEVLGVKVFDRLGKLVLSKGKGTKQIGISNNKGVFFIQIEFKNGLLRKKIVYQ